MGQHFTIHYDRRDAQVRLRRDAVRQLEVDVVGHVSGEPRGDSSLARALALRPMVMALARSLRVQLLAASFDRFEGWGFELAPVGEVRSIEVVLRGHGFSRTKCRGGRAKWQRTPPTCWSTGGPPALHARRSDGTLTIADPDAAWSLDSDW